MFQNALRIARRNADTAARLMFSQTSDAGAAEARALYREAVATQFRVSAYLTRRALRG